MTNEIKITITERGTARKYSREIKKADKATERFRVSTTGLTREIGAFRNRLLLVSFATAIVAGSIGKLTAAAGDAQETLSKFDAVFKEQGKAAKVFAEELAESTNRATIELVDFLSTLQDTFVPLGFARDAASELSQNLVKLAVDVASFNNKLDADVVRDFQSALVGNTETVRKYGIVITQAVLGQELFSSGLADSVSDATEAEKAIARYNIILASTTDAHGDAARTITSFNNTMKGAKSAVLDLSIALGEELLPATQKTVSLFTEATKAATRFIKSFNVDAVVKDQERLNFLNEEIATLEGKLGQAFNKSRLALIAKHEEERKQLILTMRAREDAAEVEMALAPIADDSTIAFDMQVEVLDRMPKSYQEAMESMRKFNELQSASRMGAANLANEIFGVVAALKRLSDPSTSGVNKFLTVFGGLLGFATGGFGGAAIGANIGGSAAEILGFEHGGSFRVSGTGGTDSQLVAFKATPGETVNVNTPGQPSGNTFNINFSGVPPTEDYLRDTFLPVLQRI